MFSICGVTEPNLDVDGLQALGRHYATLAAGTSQAHADTLAAAAAVMAENEGLGADAFNRSATGGGSIGEHLGQLADAATRTATAYNDAAVMGGTAQLSMITLAHQRLSDYADALLSFDGARAAQIVQTTRSELLTLESQGTTGVTTAFSTLNLPAPYDMSPKDNDGRLEPKIEERWAEMSDEERKATLQRMADAYADEHGFPRQKVDFKELHEDPGEILWGHYTDPGTLELNAKHLNDPHLINTVIHEMQHRAQFRGMAPRWFWEDEKNGMSRAEAERWRQLNSDGVRNKGGSSSKWDSYYPRPVEVDARRAGRQFVDDLSYEEFDRYTR